MTSWLALAAPALVAVCIIAVLGLPVSLALRLRGFTVAVVAVPAAFAVLAVSSVAAAFIGIAWSLLVPFALSLVLAAVLFAVRRWFAQPGKFSARVAHPALSEEQTQSRDLPRPALTRLRDLWVGLAAAAIGGATIALALVLGLGRGDAVSQTFDAGFHLGAVRFILDTGLASPLAMELTAPGSPTFYPTLWHGFVALIAQLTGASIPLATNAALFAVSCVVWPIGAVALGRAVAGPSTRVTVVSGIVAAAFPNMPLFLAGYGVLYPNLLGYSLLPFAMVGALLVLNLGPARRAVPMRQPAAWLLLLGALGASLIGHPNSLHVLLLWGITPVVWAALRALRVGSGLRRFLVCVGVAAYGVVLLGAWIAGRTSDDVWQGFFGPRGATLQVLGSTPHISGDAWALSVLIVLGAIIAWRTPALRWLIGSAALLATIYVIADGFPTSDWRSLFVNPWYNDPRRLAALIPFGAIPLAVLGASAGWALLRPGLRRFTAVRAASSTTGARALRSLTVLAVLLLIAIGQAGLQGALSTVRSSYDLDRARMLSADEAKLLERLPDLVPDDEVLANDPLNGSGLAYPLADREVLFPHSGGRYDPRGYELVDTLVPEPGTACEIAQEIDVNFVLDFGRDYVFDESTARAQPFKRMKELDTSPILEEVDREGEAVLYRISC